MKQALTSAEPFRTMTEQAAKAPVSLDRRSAARFLQLRDHATFSSVNDCRRRVLWLRPATNLIHAA
jgi:hypothetical protein